MSDTTAAAQLSSVFSPLSFVDRIFGIDGLSTHCCYVLPRRSTAEELDPGKLKRAMERVADKWRLIAGRVELGEVSELGRQAAWVVGPTSPRRRLACACTHTNGRQMRSKLIGAMLEAD